MGLFITIEGGEGTGKSTQSEKLSQALQAGGQKVLSTREPGGTQIGTEIRKILLHGKNSHIQALTELMLYAADRAQHVRELIRPALKADQIVICDRFQDSTHVYQGIARGLPLEWIEDLGQLATQGLKPDLTLLLDCPAELGLKRSVERLNSENSEEDRFEKEALAFHQKVRQGFLELAKYEPDRFRVIDAAKDPGEVHSDIMKIMEDVLNSKL